MYRRLQLSLLTSLILTTTHLHAQSFHRKPGASRAMQAAVHASNNSNQTATAELEPQPSVLQSLNSEEEESKNQEKLEQLNNSLNQTIQETLVLEQKTQEIESHLNDEIIGW